MRVHLLAAALACALAACARHPTPATAPQGPASAPSPAAAASPSAPAPAPAAPTSAPPAAPPPLAERAGPATTSVVEVLRDELAQIFGAPLLDHALWGVVVQSLDTGEILYSLNPTKLVMPASTMKILTLAAAAERLGWDFRYETQLLSSAPIMSGVLKGDLIVRGSGDPTIGGRDGDPQRVFRDFADALRTAGITTIEGRIIGDDDLFGDEGLGAGWAWDYLAYGYAAPSGALQYNESTVELTARAGAAPGDPVAIDVRPPGSGLAVANRATTAPAGTDVTLELRRLPGRETLEVTGQVPADAGPLTRLASVDNPTAFFVRALRAALTERGIAVRGDAVDIDEIPKSAAPPMGGDLRVLASRHSPPLAEIATVLMKVSQNLYADTLLKTLGSNPPPGTAAKGREVVAEVLTSWGIAPNQYVLYDGSGLSRYNYVTAETLVAILRRLQREPRHAAAFEAALPVAGRDGTLRGRLKGTRAEGNVRAKTGSISNVRALAGYLRTLDEERLAFAIVANHFTLPQTAIDGVIDLVVERLVNFTRR